MTFSLFLKFRKCTTTGRVELSRISNIPWFFHTDICFEKFNIMKVSSIYNYWLTCTYRTAILTSNTFLLHLFDLEKHTPTYNTGRKSTWTIWASRTSYGNQSLPYSVTVLLNTLEKLNITPESVSRKQVVISLMTSHFV